MRVPLFALLLTLAPSCAQAYVDLHAHPFMDAGLGTLFRGQFEDARLRAKDWKATFDNQMNAQALEASGLQILVVSLYAHPLINAPRHEVLRRQIRRTEEFVRSHPDWVIAKSAAEATAARAQGKRVLIFALEGASGVLEDEDDLEEFVDKHGIRIVTLLHLTDDHLGGAAFFSSFKGLFMQPVSWLAQLFCPLRDERGARLNRNGLDEDGLALTRRLIARGVWIDLAHASDESQKALIPELKKAGQPLLYTHTALRRFEGTERALADWQLDAVAESGGIVGLMPSASMLKGTPARCDDDIARLAEQFTIVAEKIGPAATVMGTDFNGGVPHLPPPRCPTGTEFDKEGLWNPAQLGHTWQALRKLGVPWPRSDEMFIGNFIGAWAKAEQAASKATSSANSSKP